MSDLTSSERRKLEKLLGMGSGYVLNFSDRTFGMFFDEFRVEIDDECYRVNGTSKANRMRTFWAIAPNNVAGRVLNGLIEYGIEEHCFDSLTGMVVGDIAVHIEDARRIAQRLLSDQPVAELEALVAISDDRDFEVLAEHVRAAIDKNQPNGALDRLHTFVVKFFRTLCTRHGIEVDRDKALHSLAGEYVKALRQGGHLDSQMTDRILKSSISVLDAFNDVRNNQSLAHDNPVLNYEESLLIFNHVAASIRFIRALELKIKFSAPNP
jgi:hypothetical protein